MSEKAEVSEMGRERAWKGNDPEKKERKRDTEVYRKSEL